MVLAMGILFVLMAGICGSTANFFMKKSLDRSGTANGYLVVHFLLSLLVGIGIYFTGESNLWSPAMFTIGAIAGLLNLTLMVLTSRALKIGAPGLTFAFQNASSLIPTLVLFAIFGEAYGFFLTPALVIGFVLVLTGLFWSSLGDQNSRISKIYTWLVYAIAIFLIQGVILTLFQWRTLLTNTTLTPHRLIPFYCNPGEAGWFIIGMFTAALSVQTLSFIANQRRGLKLNEILYGLGGGIANGASTVLLLLAVQIASSRERGILFPFFAISVIIFCSLWGQLLYKERVNWKAISIAAIGVLVGSLG